MFTTKQLQDQIEMQQLHQEHVLELPWRADAFAMTSAMFAATALRDGLAENLNAMAGVVAVIWTGYLGFCRVKATTAAKTMWLVAGELVKHCDTTLKVLPHPSGRAISTEELLIELHDGCIAGKFNPHLILLLLANLDISTQEFHDWYVANTIADIFAHKQTQPLPGTRKNRSFNSSWAGKLCAQHAEEIASKLDPKSLSYIADILAGLESAYLTRKTRKS